MRRAAIFILALAAAMQARAGELTVHFVTADGCTLEAFYQAPSSGAYVFINTHGLGSDKNEWGPLQGALKKRGFGYLSLDLRGHGASKKCGGREVSYSAFTEADWNAAAGDIEAAAAWLGKKKIPASRLVYCGASIGANLSAKAAAEGKLKPAALVLLSPGLGYAGVASEPYIMTAGRRTLIAASENDPYAWQSGNYLAAAAAKNGLQAVFLAGKGGHGVNLLRPDATAAILAWVSRDGKK